MTRHCLKGSNFACPCEACLAELQQKAREHSEHLSRLKTDTASYWTDHYSASDKAHALLLHHAGFEHREKCECLSCQVERDKRGVRHAE